MRVAQNGEPFADQPSAGTGIEQRRGAARQVPREKAEADGRVAISGCAHLRVVAGGPAVIQGGDLLRSLGTIDRTKNPLMLCLRHRSSGSSRGRTIAKELKLWNRQPAQVRGG